MKQYAKYKDSGVDFIGKIPEGWTIQRLGNLGKFSSSGIDKKTLPNQPMVKMINYTDVYGNKSLILNDKKEYMVVSASKEQKENHAVKKGDLIFTPSSETEKDIGISALVDSELPDTVFSYHVLKLEFKKEIDHDFKKYLCNNYNVLYQFSARCKGTTRQILGRDEFKTTLVVVPPIQDQKIIAKYLDKQTTRIDSLIEKRKHLIELLDEQRSASINHAVTKGINPKAKMKDSGVEWISEIPEHWKVRRLKYFGKILSGHAFPSEDFTEEGMRVIKITNIQPFAFDWSDISYLPEEYVKDYEDYFAVKGDVVFALTRPIISTGIKIAPYDENTPSIINQRTGIFKPNKEVNLNYLFYYFFSKSFYDDFALKITETNQPNISPSDVGLVYICVPPESEQLKIVEFLNDETSKIDNTLSKIEKEIALLQEYKTALISEAVTGKIDVKTEGKYA